MNALVDHRPFIFIAEVEVLELLGRHPIIRTALQRPGQEVNRLHRQTIRNLTEDALPHNFISQLFFCFGVPGCRSRQQLVEDDPQCPDITLIAVLVVQQRFRRHVQGRPNIVLTALLTVFRPHRKPKIGDLEQPLLDEYVGGFKIAMHYPLAVDFQVTGDDLLHVVHCLMFR